VSSSAKQFYTNDTFILEIGKPGNGVDLLMATRTATNNLLERLRPAAAVYVKIGAG